jgi:hypothetical protein
MNVDAEFSPMLQRPDLPEQSRPHGVAREFEKPYDSLETSPGKCPDPIQGETTSCEK